MSRLTIKQFREDSTRVDEWRAVLAMPITREVLGLINKKGPTFARADRLSWSAVDTGVALGDEQGFRDYFEHLEEMAELLPLKRDKGEEDYGAGPSPDEQK